VVLTAPTDESVRALCEVRFPPAGHEVVVVGRDSDRARVQGAGLPGTVRFVTRQASWSLGEARNHAARTARGEHLAFLDGDACADPDWVAAALERFRLDARVAAVASAAEAADGRRFAGVALDASGMPVALADGGPHASRAVLGPAGTPFVAEARAFGWVGGYDPTVGAELEDLDLGWRLWLAGFQVWFAADSRVRVPRWDLPTPSPAAARALVGRRTASVSEGHLHRIPDVTLWTRLGVDAVRPAGGRVRVLVVTPDVIAPRMAGPAIRAVEIGSALAAHHHDVEVVSTVRCDPIDAPVPVSRTDDAALRVAVARADVVVIQGHVLDHHPWIASVPQVVVVDLYDPIQLEVLEHSRELALAQRRLHVRFASETIDRQLRRGDYFLVASEKQRDLWIGQLTQAGRVNATTYDGDPDLRGLVDVVPFGIPEDPPAATAPVMRGVVPGIGADDPVILWAGGIYNWFDPLTLIRALDALRRDLPTVRLFFMGMHHPHPEVPEMEMARRTRALAEELGLVGVHVFFNEGWVEYDRRQDYLLEADVGVSTHLEHLETAYSFRTRILDYLWASLPIVATSGDGMATMIEEEGLGAVVPPGDVDGLRAALHDLLSDPARRSACRAAIAARRFDHRWSQVVAPLVTFCAAPARAPDLVDPRETALRGDRRAAAVWGSGWRQSARIALGHARRGEWDEVTHKLSVRFMRDRD